MRRVLAVELNTADRADVVGLFQRIDELVRFSRTCSLDSVCEIVDFVIGRVAAVGREIAEALLERIYKWQRLWRHRHIWTGHGLIQHTFDRPVGVVPEAGIRGLR